MTEFFRFVLLGLGIGGVYTIAAQGLVLVYRGSGVLNFAQGAIGAVGAFIYIEMMDAGFGAPLSVLASLLCGAALGAATHHLVMRPLRHASPLARLVSTLGVLTILQQTLLLRYGNEARFVDSFLPTGNWEPINGAGIGADRAWLFAIAVLLTVVLWTVYRFTRFGLLTSAVAENQFATSAVGRSPDVIASVNWALGGAIAAGAAVLLLPITGLAVLPLVLIVIPAMATALVGNFSSFVATLIGGLAIGVLESLTTRYVTAPGWPRAAPFLVIIVVLVIRGTSLPLRGHLLDRLPTVGTGRIRPVALSAAAALGALLIIVSDADRIDVIIATLGVSIIFLSVVVVTGYAGQLSLAQYALAGLGALIAAKVGGPTGVDFPLALLIGVLVAAPLGVIAAIPALRTRGATLAIATLGFSVFVERVIFANGDITGGFDGVPVRPPTLLGWDIDAINHPKRYAFTCLALFVLCALVVANVRRGPTGRRMLAVRANERAAAALGISVSATKTFAFALGAAIAATGGILLSFRTERALFSSFDMMSSINAIVMTVIGGIGFVVSALIGAAALPTGLVATEIDRFVDASRYFLIASGFGLIFTLIQQPDGVIAKIVATWRRKHPRPASKLPVEDSTSVRRTKRSTLAVRDISVRFGEVHALTDVSFTVHSGQVVGLIGPNGAGKTTMIDVISGFTKPTSGVVLLDDTRIERWGPVRRSRQGIGRSFQSLELFDDMTVLDNIRTASERRRFSSYLGDLVFPREHPLSSAAVAAIRSFGLESVLDRRPSELPYGQRRLVGIARAAASAPAVLLLDEPAAGLDDAQRAELGQLIAQLAHELNMAVLLVEHDVSMVWAVSDVVVALDFGNVIAQGSPAELTTNRDVAEAFLGKEVAPTQPVDSGALPL